MNLQTDTPPAKKLAAPSYFEDSSKLLVLLYLSNSDEVVIRPNLQILVVAVVSVILRHVRIVLDAAVVRDTTHSEAIGSFILIVICQLIHINLILRMKVHS